MRITSNTMARSYLATHQRNQTELLKTQLQLATGRRVINPSDDPGAAYRIEALQRGLESHAIHQENAEAARRRLSIEDEALGGVANILDRMRELTIRANSAVLDDVSRAGIAHEVRQLSDGLVQLANSQDGRGEYLFAGFKVAEPPFARQGQDVVYRGDQGKRMLQIGDTRRVADGDSGDFVFMAVKAGRSGVLVSPADANTGTGVVGAYAANGTVPTGSLTVQFTASNAYQVADGGGALIASGSYTSGDTLDFAGVSVPVTGNPAAGDEFTVDFNTRASVFEIADELIAVLETGGTDPLSEARRQNGFGAALNAIDGALANIGGVRTDVGARLSATESQRDINEGLALQLETTLATVRDIDYVEAISRLEAQLTSLEIAQSSFAKARQLSLFDFI